MAEHGIDVTEWTGDDWDKAMEKLAREAVNNARLQNAILKWRMANESRYLPTLLSIGHQIMGQEVNRPETMFVSPMFNPSVPNRQKVDVGEVPEFVGFEAPPDLVDPPPPPVPPGGGVPAWVPPNGYMTGPVLTSSPTNPDDEGLDIAALYGSTQGQLPAGAVSTDDPLDVAALYAQQAALPYGTKNQTDDEGAVAWVPPNGYMTGPVLSASPTNPDDEGLDIVALYAGTQGVLPYRAGTGKEDTVDMDWDAWRNVGNLPVQVTGGEDDPLTADFDLWRSVASVPVNMTEDPFDRSGAGDPMQYVDTQGQLPAGAVSTDDPLDVAALYAQQAALPYGTKNQTDDEGAVAWVPPNGYMTGPVLSASPTNPDDEGLDIVALYAGTQGVLPYRAGTGKEDTTNLDVAALYGSTQGQLPAGAVSTDDPTAYDRPPLMSPDLALDLGAMQGVPTAALVAGGGASSGAGAGAGGGQAYADFFEAMDRFAANNPQISIRAGWLPESLQDSLSNIGYPIQRAEDFDAWLDGQDVTVVPHMGDGVSGDPVLVKGAPEDLAARIREEIPQVVRLVDDYVAKKRKQEFQEKGPLAAIPAGGIPLDLIPPGGFGQTRFGPEVPVPSPPIPSPIAMDEGEERYNRRPTNIRR